MPTAFFNRLDALFTRQSNKWLLLNLTRKGSNGFKKITKQTNKRIDQTKKSNKQKNQTNKTPKSRNCFEFNRFQKIQNGKMIKC